MILDVMTLHNFRQYYQNQRIFFSKYKERNVTVIHGENGAGKTALLGAFGWCLYGKSDLPDPDDVISERAIAEAKIGQEIEAYVKLQFNDDARDYFVTRRVTGRKRSDGRLDYHEPQLELQFIDESGRTLTPKNPQDAIEQIIPLDLRNYFFFDGERIDNLTKKEGVKDIKKAIKILMGLEILERGAGHLENVKKRFREESARYGDSETQGLVREIEDLEGQITGKRQDKETLLTNRKATESELSAVRERLRTLEESSLLQQRRDELYAQERHIQGEIAEIRKSIFAATSKRGYLAFSVQLIDGARAFLEDKRAKGEIPSGLKKQFVSDLLEQGTCICGTPLVPGGEPHAYVSKWQERAGTKELEDAFIDLTGDVKVLQEEVPRLFDDLQQLEKDRALLRQRLREVQESLSQLSAQLEGKDIEEVAKLAFRDRELVSTLRDTDQAIGRIGAEIDQVRGLKEQKDKALKEKQAESDKARLAKQRMEACERVRAVMEEVLTLQSDDVQDRLQQKMSEVYKKMLRKAYDVVIDSSYSLAVNKAMGDQTLAVRMSQGERQVTSLSFIGAVVEIAREQYERDTERAAYFRGGLYPVVMDSPFGQMDYDHRIRTARALPQLAHQVVVLVSSSQWQGPVESATKGWLGRQYELVYRSPKQDSSIPYEFTEIKEVKHA